ncbi:sporulation protein YunB [Dethiothermospora halolimnae]|uniref:sporulation protein YunB n=1 Tax=Dethiothermospora halolimnae TaxID=3114390 RepID=UPI003CCC0455
MRNRKSKKKGFFIAIVLILVFSIYGFIIVEKNIKPTILAMSEAKARMIATQAINEAVQTKIQDDIKYKDLIFVRTDNRGKVTMMQANTVLMNSIASDVALEVQDQMRQIATNSIRVPLGSVLNSQILAKYGPKIKVEIVPQGTVTVDFSTEFQNAGINQTIHKVYLVINSKVRIIVPLTSNTVEVSSTVPIAETVIVGDVPESYIFVPEEEFWNAVPTD